MDVTLNTNNRIVLCFIPFYLPGNRSGGPVRTISNLVDHLGDEYTILIVTRDRDFLDHLSYPDITIDAWNYVGKSKVFYASSSYFALFTFAKILRDTPHDLLYLNSFFSFDFSFLPLVARLLHIAPSHPCIIAPRGEFSKGALSLKSFKKKIYMFVFKILGLSRDLVWQASTKFEFYDIRRELRVDSDSIQIASDLPPIISFDNQTTNTRKPGILRLGFLSRISRKKNLDFLLNVFSQLNDPCVLYVYGPTEDPEYWSECQTIIQSFPDHLKFIYGGEVNVSDVVNTFASFDLFVFPTRGENYGHVILESLTAGTPVLVSDQTPWASTFSGSITALPLDSYDSWLSSLRYWISKSEDDLAKSRKAALSTAINFYNDSNAIDDNRILFNKAISLAL